MQRKEEEDQENTTAAETPEEVETPIAFAPKDLPSSVMRDIESLSFSHDAESSSDTFADDRFAGGSSPTLSFSTVSDLTPTELGDDIGEDSSERVPTHHKTFYLEDGNVEIVCGHTMFRVHSPVISFSSPALRNMLSPSTLLNSSMPGGCPRIVFMDSAEDFAVLLKMIYIPGYISPTPDIDSVD